MKRQARQCHTFGLYIIRRNLGIPGPRNQGTVTTHKHDNDKDGKDKYCYFCGMNGHEPPECNFMAKLVRAQESLNRVDQKTKKALKERFKQEQQKQREKRLTRRTKTIRQLIDSGATNEEVENFMLQDENEKDTASTTAGESTAQDDSDSETTESE
jgi:hypothetical protein